MNEKIYSYALRLLVARDYSVGILEEKIFKKFKYAEKPEVQEIINDLCTKNYLNDSRTAENFVRYRREYFPRGKMLIEQEMWKKKFSPEIIAEALQKNFSQEQELECCRKLGIKKIPSIQAREENGAKQKEKFCRFLAGKGFSYNMISTIWEEIVIHNQ